MWFESGVNSLAAQLEHTTTQCNLSLATPKGLPLKTSMDHQQMNLPHEGQQDADAGRSTGRSTVLNRSPPPQKLVGPSRFGFEWLQHTVSNHDTFPQRTSHLRIDLFMRG